MDVCFSILYKLNSWKDTIHCREYPVVNYLFGLRIALNDITNPNSIIKTKFSRRRIPFDETGEWFLYGNFVWQEF